MLVKTSWSQLSVWNVPENSSFPGIMLLLSLFPQGATHGTFSISIHFLALFWPGPLKVTSQILISHITSGVTGRKQKSRWTILTPPQSPAKVADVHPSLTYLWLESLFWKEIWQSEFYPSPTFWQSDARNKSETWIYLQRCSLKHYIQLQKCWHQCTCLIRWEWLNKWRYIHMMEETAVISRWWFQEHLMTENHSCALKLSGKL